MMLHSQRGEHVAERPGGDDGADGLTSEGAELLPSVERPSSDDDLRGSDVERGSRAVVYPSPGPAPLPSSLATRLYVSHFLSTWNSRLFEFGAVLFLASIYPGTLLPMSTYALARGLAAVLFASAVGSWIDRGDRLVVVRASIVGQRTAVAGSCAAFWVMERWKREGELDERVRVALFGLVVVLACVEKLCSVMNLIAVERDWVVVITDGNEPARQDLNSKIRRIDLSCKLLGPLLIALVNGVSSSLAILTALGMNVASVVVEYVCIARVYRLVPALRRRTSDESSVTIEDDIHPIESPPAPWSAINTILSWVADRAQNVLPLSSIPFYLGHPAFLPSFSLALLYLTVLSFSGQMVTFLLSAGFDSAHVGAVRTISTLFELSATLISPALIRRIGTVRAGIWSLSWQMIWLTVGAAWFFADWVGPRTSSLNAVGGLVAGVILSRIGLWGYDLAAQSIVQDEVDVRHRGAFSTTEAAAQNLFELLAYASTMVFSRPDQFQWPILLSVVAVYVAGGLYASYVRRRRGHLFHAPPCLQMKADS